MTSTIDSAVLSALRAACFTPAKIIELLRSQAALHEEVTTLKQQLAPHSYSRNQE